MSAVRERDTRTKPHVVALLDFQGGGVDRTLGELIDADFPHFRTATDIGLVRAASAADVADALACTEDGCDRG